MEDVNTGLREIDETSEILKELAIQQRGRVAAPASPPAIGVGQAAR
jgi:hypothetical protein